MKEIQVVVFGISKERALEQYIKLAFDQKEKIANHWVRKDFPDNPIYMNMRYGFEEETGIRGLRCDYAFVDCLMSEDDVKDYVIPSLAMSVIETPHKNYEYFNLIKE